MRVEITAEEQAVVIELLEQAYRDLKEEIYHSEARDFKDQLKSREALLANVLQKLGRETVGDRVA